MANLIAPPNTCLQPRQQLVLLNKAKPMLQRVYGCCVVRQISTENEK